VELKNGIIASFLALGRRSNPVGALGKNLMSSSTLQMLKLNFCSLPSLGAAALFRSFAVNKALRCVDLSHSHIFHGDHAVTALCQSLPEMTGLESLNLCCTGLSGFAVQGIFQGLQRNSVLQFLDLSDNPDIGSHIATSLIEGLPRMLGLQILNVQMTGLSAHLDQRPDLMKALAKGMTVNSKLWKIDDIILHRVDYYETPPEQAKQGQCLRYLKEIELHKMRNGVLNGKWLTMDQISLWPFVLTRVASSTTFRHDLTLFLLKEKCDLLSLRQNSSQTTKRKVLVPSIRPKAVVGRKSPLPRKVRKSSSKCAKSNLSGCSACPGFHCKIHGGMRLLPTRCCTFERIQPLASQR
jgi:hypothetical protein